MYALQADVILSTLTIYCWFPVWLSSSILKYALLGDDHTAIQVPSQSPYLLTTIFRSQPPLGKRIFAPWVAMLSAVARTPSAISGHLCSFLRRHRKASGRQLVYASVWIILVVRHIQQWKVAHFYNVGIISAGSFFSQLL